MVCIVSLMGVRRFFAVGWDCDIGLFLVVKMGLKVVCDFYTHFYTFGQWRLERRMDIGFVLICSVSGCTFNPFVVGSTPAGPTKIIKS